MVIDEDEAKVGASEEVSGEEARALPSGWTKHWSTEHNHVYYAHAVTQQVTWKHPTLALEQARGESLQHQKDEGAAAKAKADREKVAAVAGAMKEAAAKAMAEAVADAIEKLRKETREKTKAIERLRKETEEKLRKETGEMVKVKEELKRRRKAVAETKAMHRAMVGKIKKVKANAKSKAQKIAKGDLVN